MRKHRYFEFVGVIRDRASTVIDDKEIPYGLERKQLGIVGSVIQPPTDIPVDRFSREAHDTGKVKFTEALEEPPVGCFMLIRAMSDERFLPLPSRGRWQTSSLPITVALRTLCFVLLLGDF
ncbi:hypothetical protein Q8A67_025111 [Cirrhinus molitorella]|uniref:Uncharacterized protein n=1 Tax=Cirrhinus molitorella TaxID=172907 RepID=A0AA88NZ61_9TELE|nr:hypothetical protein Q8A67_025111 [Cirrhinus molitorella]